MSGRPAKAACLSSGASIGAAIVEAEESLETEVCSSALGEAVYIYRLQPVFMTNLYG